jgi:hypothetical protein
MSDDSLRRAVLSMEFLLIGLPSWVLVDGTWSCLSQLAQNLPEGYNISSYLMISLTLGNVFPIALGSTFLSSASYEQIRWTVYGILMVGLLAGVSLSQCWDLPVTIKGTPVSIPLFVLFFVVGSCASTSNVTHFTLVSSWPAKCTTYLATGMGVGPMIAGILALIQGFYSETFTVSLFYILLTSLYIPAFYGIQRVGHRATPADDAVQYKSIQKIDDIDESLHTSIVIDNDTVEFTSTPTSTGIHSDRTWSLLRQHYRIFLLQMVNSSMGYGLVPSLISFACGKFTNRKIILLLATSIASTIDPCFRWLTNYVRLDTIRAFKISTFFLVIFSVALSTLAKLPPTSRVFSTQSMSFLPVVVYVMFNVLHVFTNTSLFLYLKDAVESHPMSLGGLEHGSKDVQNAYRLAGIASQTGALLGTTFTFVAIITGFYN